MGAGDGKAALRRARADPAATVIGVEPAWQQLVAVAGRARQRPERGGAPNLWFVAATAEEPPAELLGVVDEIHATMPWGSLLAGLVRPERRTLDGLAALAKPGAALRVLIATDAWREPVPHALRGLERPSPELVTNALACAYASAGWRITDARWLDTVETRAVESSWARRLTRGHAAPAVLRIDATRDG
nr:hypothetical protein [Pseudonocardia sp. TRM90224]